METIARQVFLGMSGTLFKPAQILLELNCDTDPQQLVTPLLHICCTPSAENLHVLENQLLRNTKTVILQNGPEILAQLPDKSIGSLFVHLQDNDLQNNSEESLEQLLQACERVASQQIAVQSFDRKTVEDIQNLVGNDSTWQFLAIEQGFSAAAEFWSIRTLPQAPAIEVEGKIGLVSIVFPPHDSGQAIMIGRLLHDVNPQQYVLISSRNYAASVLPYTLLPHRNSRLGGQFHQIKTSEPTIIVGRHFLKKTVIETVEFLLSVFQRSREIAKVLRAEKCNKVIGCSGDIHDFPAAFIASRLAGVPFYAYMFDYYSFQSVNPTQRRLCRFFERLALRNAAKVIVPNDYLGEAYRTKYGVQYTVIHNPLAPDADISVLNNIWPCSADEIKIVYTGQVYEAQFDALRNLVQALAQLNRPNVKLHIYTAQPAERIVEHGIYGPVVFHPHQPAHQIRLIQQEADILFLPLAFHSPYPEIILTSAPSKMGEYLASGRPILAHAPVGSFINWYFQKYRCGAVVDQEEPGLLVQAIQNIIEEADYRQTITQNAQERAKADFDLVHTQKQLFALLDNRSSNL